MVDFILGDVDLINLGADKIKYLGYLIGDYIVLFLLM